jgi:voltage-gated potassium channel
MKRARRSRLRRFIADVQRYTPLNKMVLLLVVLWLVFSLALYWAERDGGGSSIDSFGDALYWSTAAFSTAGIADTPSTAAAKLIGGVWIVVGSLLFFGTIVATVTGYFMRPLQRPHKRIIDTVEYNLEQLEELDIVELDLLKETVDALIEHMEKIKSRQSSR